MIQNCRDSKIWKKPKKLSLDALKQITLLLFILNDLICSPTCRYLSPFLGTYPLNFANIL
jgi:hypothetical protein